MSTVTPEADILIDAECWQELSDAETIVQRAITAAADMVDLPEGEIELAVMLTDDDGVRVLNKTWRGIDKPTNVLSFPAPDMIGSDHTPRMLGDIAIAYQTTRREAETDSKPLENHLTHLTVHGFLHLLGYDHQTDDKAAIMEELERTILARLDIPDPYAHDDQAS